MRMLEVGPRTSPALEKYESEHEVIYLDAVDRLDKDVIVHTLQYPDAGLPFPDDHFDYVYASHIYEHIPYYHEQRAFEDVYRVLRKGGQFHVIVPNGKWIGERLFKEDWEIVFKGWMFGGLIDEFDVHLNVFTPKSLKWLLEETGFSIYGIQIQRLIMTQGEHSGKTEEIQALGVKK